MFYGKPQSPGLANLAVLFFESFLKKKQESITHVALLMVAPLVDVHGRIGSENIDRDVSFRN